MALLRRDGFEATSLEALTHAMGISRSSFYAAFGSKRGVLLAALDRYSRERIAALDTIATGVDGVAAVLRAIAGIETDAYGCLLVNCVVELSPRDAEVADLGAAHLRRVEAIVAARLPTDRRDAAPALVATALGAQTLRKSGAEPKALAAMIELATARLTAR